MFFTFDHVNQAGATGLEQARIRTRQASMDGREGNVEARRISLQFVAPAVASDLHAMYRTSSALDALPVCFDCKVKVAKGERPKEVMEGSEAQHDLLHLLGSAWLLYLIHCWKGLITEN